MQLFINQKINNAKARIKHEQNKLYEIVNTEEKQQETMYRYQHIAYNYGRIYAYKQMLTTLNNA